MLGSAIAAVLLPSHQACDVGVDRLSSSASYCMATRIASGQAAMKYKDGTSLHSSGKEGCFSMLRRYLSDPRTSKSNSKHQCTHACMTEAHFATPSQLSYPLARRSEKKSKHVEQALESEAPIPFEKSHACGRSLKTEKDFTTVDFT